MHDAIVNIHKYLQENTLDALLLPRSDEHLGEYILPHAERVKWLTGFTGSAGFVIITQDTTALFVDGRYTLQAPRETKNRNITVLPINPTPSKWLTEKLTKGARVGYDPMLHSMSELKHWSNFTLIPIENPVSPLAPYPNEPIVDHPLKYAGLSRHDKIAALREKLRADKAECTVFCQLDSIAWLLNIRGSDIPNMPVAQSFLVITLDKTIWFVDRTKLQCSLEGLEIQPLESFMPPLNNVYLTPEVTTQWIANQCTNIIEGKDLIDLPRAMKNAAEIEGAKAAHIRDGVALVKFLHWFALTNFKDELIVTEMLYNFRAEHPFFRGNSFETIAGAGENAAIVHYRSTKATNRVIADNSLFLLDSGGQYIDGTTDITRTLSQGEITPTMKKHYTLVLKGHLALSRAVFPVKTSGAALDALARQFLWQEGLNFDHGTGHGVGSYLGVHEGSFRISPLSQQPFHEGMILSNEPGYYEAGSHGIRIENLLLIEQATAGFFKFRTLTLAPYDKKAIDKSLLTLEEKAQINTYHARVYADIGAHLKGATRDYLKKLCAKI